jgi:intein/homing endonuclease
VTKIDENVFDSIDTEEKAYWLGFIYADGCIGSSDNSLEISLKSSDSEHLEKFNSFIKGPSNKVKIGNVKCGDKICERCRWAIHNFHIHEVLNSYGCVPAKSLILEFPNESIFKNKSLIRHFIRGYWDGDGCLSYCDKKHLCPNASVLGTENFLSSM